MSVRTTSLSFAHLATVVASTKRAPAPVSGKVGKPVTYLPEVKCVPLDPVDPEVQQRLGLGGPLELLQTFVEYEHDIVEGDILVVGLTEYPIKACEDWAWGPRDEKYRRLVLEELK